MEAVLLLVGAIFLLAGFVKGVTGMGLPTLSMALLSLTMSPGAAASLLLLPSLLTNVAQCTGPHLRTLARRLWPMWLGLFIVTIWSPLPDVSTGGNTARIALAVVLVAYGAVGLANIALPDLNKHAIGAGEIAGGLTGVLTATTGVFVIPMVPYLQSLRLPKEEMIQALGLSFTIATIALSLRLGVFSTNTASIDIVDTCVGVIAAFVGLGLGAAVRRRLRPVYFQRALFCVFIILGLITLGRAL